MSGRKKKIRRTGGKRIALTRYSVKEIMDMHDAFQPGQTIPIFEVEGEKYKARVYCSRLRTFAKGTQCVKCGLKGEYFQLERMTDAPRGIAHLNMYAERDGEQILFTKDHIVPRAQGGANKVTNMQPMCETCNGLKGARPEHKYKIELIDPDSGQTFTKTFGCDEEYAIRAAKALLFDTGLSRDIDWELFFWEPHERKWIQVWS